MNILLRYFVVFFCSYLFSNMDRLKCCECGEEKEEKMYAISNKNESKQNKNNNNKQGILLW